MVSMNNEVELDLLSTANLKLEGWARNKVILEDMIVTYRTVVRLD